MQRDAELQPRLVFTSFPCSRGLRGNQDCRAVGTCVHPSPLLRGDYLYLHMLWERWLQPTGSNGTPAVGLLRLPWCAAEFRELVREGTRVSNAIHATGPVRVA